MSSSVPAIELIDVNKWFGDFHVLKDINLTVGTGERVVVCVAPRGLVNLPLFVVSID